MPGGGSRGCRLLHVGDSEVGHEEEEQGVGRNVKVEIDEAMNEKTTTADQTGELQSAGERMIELAGALQGSQEQNTQEPRATEPAKNARVREGFEIVIVRVVYDFSVEKGFVGRKDDLERAKTRADDGMIQENVPGVAPHGGALSRSGFERLQSGKPLEDLADTQPRDDQQRRKHDTGSRQQLLAGGTAENDDEGKDEKFRAETDDASAGRGKEEGRHGENGK